MPARSRDKLRHLLCSRLAAGQRLRGVLLAVVHLAQYPMTAVFNSRGQTCNLSSLDGRRLAAGSTYARRCWRWHTRRIFSINAAINWVSVFHCIPLQAAGGGAGPAGGAAGDGVPGAVPHDGGAAAHLPDRRLRPAAAPGAHNDDGGRNDVSTQNRTFVRARSPIQSCQGPAAGAAWVSLLHYNGQTCDWINNPFSTCADIDTALVAAPAACVHSSGGGGRVSGAGLAARARGTGPVTHATLHYPWRARGTGAVHEKWHCPLAGQVQLLEKWSCNAGHAGSGALMHCDAICCAGGRRTGSSTAATAAAAGRRGRPSRHRQKFCRPANATDWLGSPGCARQLSRAAAGAVASAVAPQRAVSAAVLNGASGTGMLGESQRRGAHHRKATGSLEEVTQGSVRRKPTQRVVLWSLSNTGVRPHSACLWPCVGTDLQSRTAAQTNAKRLATGAAGCSCCSSHGA